MTTLTKIFVILVCLFSFIFTPMAIQFAARTHNWRGYAMQLQDVAETALATERSAIAFGASQVEHYKALRDQENERFLDAQKQITELQQKMDRLIQERDQLARSEENWENSAQLLAAEITIKSRLNNDLTEAKEKALASERALRVAFDELNDRFKKLFTDFTIVEQQLKQKLQEITAISKENEELRERLQLGKAGEVITATPMPSVKPITPPAGSPILGAVTEVRGDLVSIDVGSASGVKPGMKIVVLRGNDSYICDLEITSNVTPGEAVGEISLIPAGSKIRVGDTVMDEYSFNHRN